MHQIAKLATAMLLALLPVAGQAQWEIDNDRSSVNFISIKNDVVAETHSFGSLVGYIGTDGKVQVGIDLDSVETLIPIRNERMRELLFQTASFPTANISAQVDPGIIEAAAQGGIVTADVQVGLSLHGQDSLIVVPVVVMGEPGGPLRVVSARPVLINAANFGLEAGVNALREIAGLNSISTAVPVTLNLVFVPATAS